jgi:hypothetical protein
LLKLGENAFIGPSDIVFLLDDVVLELLHCLFQHILVLLLAETRYLGRLSVLLDGFGLIRVVFLLLTISFAL